MYEPGDHICMMPRHKPSDVVSLLPERPFEVKSIFEIETTMALPMAESIEWGLSTKLLESNKRAYVVTDNEEDILIIYKYDKCFFLTVLHRKV